MQVYLVALLGQVITTSLVDIFKQQNLDVFRSKWFQLLSKASSARSCQRRSVEAGGRGMDCRDWGCREAKAI